VRAREEVGWGQIDVRLNGERREDARVGRLSVVMDESNRLVISAQGGRYMRNRFPTERIFELAFGLAAVVIVLIMLRPSGALDAALVAGGTGALFGIIGRSLGKALARKRQIQSLEEDRR